MWAWLDNAQSQATWGFILRVIVKAVVLFALCNLVYALVNPLGLLGRASLYGAVIPARDRFPYGEQPSQSYSVTITDLNTMFASHAVAQPKAADEFRVLLVGDSATWGWLLEHDETYAAYINAAGVQLDDGRRVVAYNLGYPTLSLTKDLLILDAARRYEPDLIVWLVTLESFPPDKQIPANPLDQPIVHDNPQRVRELAAQHDLALAVGNLTAPGWFAQTLIGERRDLADWLRLQLYGFSWAGTGIDQVIGEYDLRRSDFAEDGLLAFNQWDAPTTLTRDDLAFDVLAAGVAHADAPVILVNEPMFISSGENSNQRYNSLYPRWVYDQYRALLAELAAENDWRYVDWWDIIAPDEFTDSPVHLTLDGSQALADRLLTIILEAAP